jgi:2-polyprenyl-3-methyl-5-hydroxy-6-metoxy-1,4-benzoquinol methylase
MNTNLETSVDVIEREAQFFDKNYVEGRLSELGFLVDSPGTRWIARLLGGLEGKAILDLGCGVGSGSLGLAIRGAKVHAIDVSREAVRLTQYNADRFNIRLAGAHVMSATELAFPDETFDAVCGVAILHHLLHHAFGQQVMAEVWRVLKPGGRAVFLENNGDNGLLMLLRRHMRLVGGRRIGDDDERPLTAAAVRERSARFRTVRFIHFELFFFRIASTWLPWFRRYGRIFTRLDWALSFSPTLNRLGYSRMVYLEK